MGLHKTSFSGRRGITEPQIVLATQEKRIWVFRSPCAAAPQAQRAIEAHASRAVTQVHAGDEPQLLSQPSPPRQNSWTLPQRSLCVLPWLPPANDKAGQPCTVAWGRRWKDPGRCHRLCNVGQEVWGQAGGSCCSSGADSKGKQPKSSVLCTKPYQGAAEPC